jgi:hypothetical protein
MLLRHHFPDFVYIQTGGSGLQITGCVILLPIQSPEPMYGSDYHAIY